MPSSIQPINISLEMDTDRDFPAGLLGTYYAARHSFGHFRSSAVTACYTLHHGAPPSSIPEDRVIQLLQTALRRVLVRHPALCYGIIEETAATEAHFTRIPVIHWHDVAQIHSVTTAPGEEDITLAKELEKAHEQPFKNQQRQPAWRLVMLFHGGSARVDVSFVVHHAIADGISGTAFHRSLAENLEWASTQNDVKETWTPYAVPMDLPRPVFIEDACPLSLSKLPLPTSAPAPSTLPPSFAFAPPLVASSPTRITILTISPASLATILTHCHTAFHPPLTLTSLLHALTVIYLARNIPLLSTHSLQACTPFSMRRFSQQPTTEILNHISTTTTSFSPSLLALAHASTPTSGLQSTADENEVISRLAQHYAASMDAELARVPVEGATALRTTAAMVNGDEELGTSLRAAERRPRELAYEISNVGMVELPVKTGEEVVLDKLVFTQCGMPVGPAVACSVVSVQKGPLCLGFTWQEGVVEDEVVEGLKGFLGERLLALGSGA